jgi:hypothetical protein
VTVRQSAGLTVSPGSRLPSSFFSVHRLVRTLQQRAGIVAVLGVAGEADARRNAQDRSFPDNGLSNGCANLVHQRGESRAAARPCEHNYELITSETGDCVRLPDHTLQPLRYGDQHRIPGFVAPAVVDVLEPIQVDEEQGKSIVALLRFAQPSARSWLSRSDVILTI